MTYVRLKFARHKTIDKWFPSESEVKKHIQQFNEDGKLLSLGRIPKSILDYDIIDEIELKRRDRDIGDIFELYCFKKGIATEEMKDIHFSFALYNRYDESFKLMVLDLVRCANVSNFDYEEFYGFLKSRCPNLPPYEHWKTNKRIAIKGTVRQNVLMRDNYTCQICGKTVKDGAKLEIDHIIPVSKGGTNNESNLQVLCRQCNREKHNRTDLLHDKLKLEELNNEVKL